MIPKMKTRKMNGFHVNSAQEISHRKGQKSMKRSAKSSRNKNVMHLIPKNNGFHLNQLINRYLKVERQSVLGVLLRLHTSAKSFIN